MAEPRGVQDRRVSTGIAELDLVLGGLFWGDNVVWELDGTDAHPFYAAILGLEEGEKTTYTAPNGREIAVEVVKVETYSGQ